MQKSFYYLKTQSKRIAASAVLIVAFGTVLSRLTGLIRIRVLSTNLGAGQELDAFYAAFRLPDLLTSLLVSGTLSVAFIPIFAKYLNANKVKAAQLAKTTLGITAAAIAVIMSFVAIFAPFFSKLFFSEFDLEQIANIALLTRYIAAAQILLAVSVLASSILQSFKQFFYPAMAASLYNLGIIAGAVFFYPALGLVGLGWGVILGSLVHLAIQAPSLVRHIKTKTFNLSPKPALKELWKLYWPRLLYLDIGQASLLVATMIAAGLATGTVSTYTLGYDLALAPIGIIASSVVTAAYPGLSSLWVQGQKERFFESLINAGNKILQWMLPASFALYVFRLPITQVLFQGGKFGIEDTLATAGVLAGLCAGLPALGLLPLLTRAFWAMGRARWPLAVTWTGIILYAIVANVFAKGGHELSLALSLVAWISVILLGTNLALKFNKIPSQLKPKLLKPVAKVLLGTVVQSLPAAIFGAIILNYGSWPALYSLAWFFKVSLAGLSSSLIYFFAKRFFDKHPLNTTQTQTPQ